MRLDEILTNHQEIVDTLWSAMRINNDDDQQNVFTISPDGKVNLIHGLTTTHLSFPIKELPVQFGACHGNFDVDKFGLETLKGCPHEIDGYFSAISNSLTSLEYAPKIIRGGAYINKNNITSLVGITDIFDTIEGYFYFDFDKVTEGGLGLLLIKGIQGLKGDNLLGFSDKALPEQFQIINSYLGRPQDIYECQAKLIENGYEEYAKL